MLTPLCRDEDAAADRRRTNIRVTGLRRAISEWPSSLGYRAQTVQGSHFDLLGRTFDANRFDFEFE